MQPTIYDVAKKAGVSIATVSKVINNNGRIGKDTRKKVLKIMEELNYHPSVLASGLTRKRTETIGVLIPDLANPFFAEITASMEERAHELGLSVVICSTNDSEEKEAKYISLLMRKKVDGCILASRFTQVSLIENMIKQGIPVALTSQDIPSLNLNTVSVDDYKGGYQATAHLASLGHKKIATIAEKNVRSSHERIKGYMDAMIEKGLAVEDTYIVEVEPTVKGGKEAAERLLTSEDPPTAIFAGNDILAIGVSQGARACQLEIPNDFSVVGFDNTLLATICDPPLTTIAQPIQQIGRQIVDVLVSEINGELDYKQRIMLPPELVVRESTKKLFENKVSIKTTIEK
ncbi:LacI family transcriptional regulator [Alkalihalobacillus sp. MEB130]|uniref:LacI family DNA-binding transcriptional regulator n=1 Tax=Alkalihalobacillus sp. MEB130 TaxID=2976704 RepID=UPI0028DEDEAD|nr:LacI family DNA-binding transcriptional regulator [Alkalihalobacillus sp. MEB130]MDT8860135.1 LacI family transcriptional regulator [Alkalihalobacillus sp. MEB130]